jgi:WD40 repeat protein
MIYTFYSFKGGVGRSMAMAAVAHLMAQRGLKVLTIDFDLEAPGLERYFFDEQEQLRTARGTDGLIDLLLAYKRALTNRDEFARADFKKWSSYIVDAIPRTPEGGSVDLITAGRRYPPERLTDYALSVRNFDWQDFFHNWRGGLFFDWLRRELTQVEEHGYDAVLVDSRTGVTEMGGICAYQLADVSVLLCAPNYQNIDGTRAVVDDFRSDAVMALRGGRPLEVLVLPARIEQMEPLVADARDRFFNDFTRVFGTDGLPKALGDVGLDYRRLAVPYQPELSISELVMDDAAGASGARVASRTALGASFETLADALIVLGDGDRWSERSWRRDAQARLRREGTGTLVAPVADLSKREAGYDALVYSSWGDTWELQQFAAALSARRLNIQTLTADVRAEPNAPSLLQLLSHSQALLLACVSDNAADDMYWTLRNEARAARKTIVHVLLPRSGGTLRALPYGLDQDEVLDLRDGIDASTMALDRLASQLTKPARSQQRPESSAELTPYPGGAAFSEDQASLYFGRGTELDMLAREFERHDVVWLTGDAGVGKSSLVHAGLVPRVRRGEPPFDAELSERTLPDRKGSSWSIELIDFLVSPPPNRPEQESSAFAIGSHKHESSGGRPALLIIDHLDSMPDGGGEAEQARRERLVTSARSAAGPSRKILIVCRGVWDRSTLPQSISALRETRVHLRGLPDAALRAALEQPLARVGYLFEAGLVDRLLNDGGIQPGVVGLVQLAAHELWGRRRRGWLTNNAYDAMGGIAGAFERRLKAFLDRAGPTDSAPALELLVNLVRFDPQLRLIAEPRDWTALANIPALAERDAIALRDRLVQQRLIDLWHNSEDGSLVCGLAQPIAGPTIENAAREDPEFILWRQRFDSFVHGYVLHGRRGAEILSGEALGEAERFYRTRFHRLSAEMRHLIEAALQARDAREADERRLELERFETERIAAERDRAEAARQLATRVARRAQWISRTLAAVLVLLLFAILLSVVQFGQSLDRQRQMSFFSIAWTAAGVASTDPTAAARAVSDTGEDPKSWRELEPGILSLLDKPLARVRLPHGGAVAGAVFSPVDPQRLLSRTDDGRAMMWSSTGKRLAELKDGNTRIQTVNFSPDGQVLAAGADDPTVRLFDLQGRVTARLVGHGGPVRASIFSLDGRFLLTASDDTTARLWTSQGDAIARLPLSYVPIMVAFDGTGKTFATMAGNDVRIWDMQGRPIATLSDLTRGVAAVGLYNGGWITTSLVNGTTHVWDFTGKRLATLPGDGVMVVRAYFSLDRRHVALLDEDGQVRLFDMQTLSRVPLKGSAEWISSVAFSRDGRYVATASATGLARLWDLDGRSLAELRGHSRGVRSVAFSADGLNIATGSDDDSVRVWKLQGRPMLQLRTRQGRLRAAAFSPDGKLVLAASDDGTARLWTLDGTQVCELDGHRDTIRAVAFRADGQRIATGSADGTARLWNLRCEPLGLLQAKGTGTIIAVAFAPSGRHLMVGERDGTTRLWTLEADDARSTSARIAATLPRHATSIHVATFSPDGTKVATASETGVGRLWDVAGKTIDLKGHDDEITGIAFSPDGQRVVTASRDKTAMLWNLSGRALHRFRRHGRPLTAAIFSPDGQRLLTASEDGTACLWTLNGQLVTELHGHTGRVLAIAFRPDGRRIATGSEDGSARLWDLTGRSLTELVGHNGSVVTVEFSPDGHRLLTGSADGAARVWPIGVPAFRERVEQITLPCLDAAERERMLLESAGVARERAVACARQHAP